jgi:citrate lyase beta subunit
VFQASTNHDALRTARCAVAMAAHACAVQPLDGPFVRFKDGYIPMFRLLWRTPYMIRSAALEKEIIHVRMLGFSGKFAIHPDQVQILRRGFRPSDADISCVAVQVFPQMPISQFISESPGGQRAL